MKGLSEFVRSGLAKIGIVSITLSQIALFTEALQVVDVVTTTLGSRLNVIHMENSVIRRDATELTFSICCLQYLVSGTVRNRVAFNEPVIPY